MAAVKVHRVFPSRRLAFASSRRFQIHRGGAGDSGEVVKPFMQVGTYPTRNFATLEPSEIQLPFTGVCLRSGNPSGSPPSTGQASDPIPHLAI